MHAIQAVGGVSELRSHPEVTANAQAVSSAEPSGAAPPEIAADGNISQDILDALPLDIRAEVLMQRQHTQPTGPTEMDNASFFATLTPELRQEMLLTASEVVLQQLPAEMVAEAHVLRGRTMNNRRNNEAQRWVQRAGQYRVDRGMRVITTDHRMRHAWNTRQPRYALGDRLLSRPNARTPIPNLDKETIKAVLKKGSQPLVNVQEIMQICKLLYLQGRQPRDAFYSTSIAKTPLAGFFFNVSFSPNCLRPLLKKLLHIATENPKSVSWDDGENPPVTSFALANGRALEVLVDLLTRLPCRSYFTHSVNTLANILSNRLCESAPHTLQALKCMKVLLCEDEDRPTSAGATPRSLAGFTTPRNTTQAGVQVGGAVSSSATVTASDDHESALALRKRLEQPAVKALVHYLCNAPTHDHEKSVQLCTETVSAIYQKSEEETHANAANIRAWVEQGLLTNARHFISRVSSSIHTDGLPYAALFLRLLHSLRHVYKENDRIGLGPRLQTFLDEAGADNLWKTLDLSLCDKTAGSDWSRHMPLIEAFFIVHNYEDGARKEEEYDDLEDVVRSPRRDRLRGFCARHAKSINHIVKQTPILLTTSLQAVVKFAPNVLDFSNKRNLFRQRLRAYRGDAKYETIRLHVRRSDIFIDSYHQLRHRSAEEMRGKLAVQFVGEDGMDAGGLTREWFETLAKEMFNPNYALFAPAGGRPSTFHPNSLSYVNPDHLSFFGFVGRVVGKAVHDNHTLKAYFTMSLYKNLLRRKVHPQDLEALDPDYFKSMKYILQPNGTKGLDLTFTADLDTFGHYELIDLKENGASTPVTEDNKDEYVQLMCEHKMIHSVKQQLDTFMKGFHELVPSELISIFDDKELELLICGLPVIDLNDLRRNTEYHNYTEQSTTIKWFWKFLGEFTEEQKAWLLQFVTGTSQVPLEGFKSLVGMRGPQKFSIHRAGGCTDRLPTAHTCFNQLDLPEYTTEEIFRQKLLQAIEEAHEGFGFI